VNGNSNNWERRRHDSRIAKNADQTEYNALEHGKTNLEAGTFDDRIADALDDYEVSDPLSVESWASSDLVFDNAVSDIGIELARRSALLGECYPFELNGNQLKYRGSQSLAYELCLAISESPSLSHGDYKKLPVAFERLMKDILVTYMGQNAVGFRTGWPPDGDRPTKFKDLISDLNASTGEWIWNPDFELPDDPRHQDVKDEGLDFVIWKNVGDGRSGSFFLLGQCACGNDWETKFYDIDPEFAKLGRWMKPVVFAKPYRAFCIPRHIPNNTYFSQVNKEAGLTFDRTRISILAEQSTSSSENRSEFESLIKIAVNGFQVV